MCMHRYLTENVKMMQGYGALDLPRTERMIVQALYSKTAQVRCFRACCTLCATVACIWGPRCTRHVPCDRRNWRSSV